MIYGSVCSGIEAATVAWHPLGWTPAWFAEIEKFPSAVLAHHYPGVPNLGDMNLIGAQHGPVDVLVGGTPCQSFSVAGLRRGMDDPRGNLALVFLRLVRDLRPRWVLWENVPGVLSSNGGRDFGSIVGGLAELGYGWAYRVLDAQFWGVAQRRRRVFVVAHSRGAFQRAAAVLFEPSSLRGDPAPRREAGQGVAGTLGNRLNRSRTELDGHGAYVPLSEERVAPTLDASFGRLQGCSGQDSSHGHGHLTVEAFWGGRSSGALDVATACNAHSGRQDFESETLVAEPIAFHVTQDPISGDVAPAMSQGNRQGCATLGDAQRSAVRRLTPRECARLQGFPDDYLDIPGASDSGKYKALGNSMAVPVMRWIGERMGMVDRIVREAA